MKTERVTPRSDVREGHIAVVGRGRVLGAPRAGEMLPALELLGMLLIMREEDELRGARDAGRTQVGLHDLAW